MHLSVDAFESCDLVIVTYGGSAELAVEAAERLLLEHEIASDVLVLSQLAPFPIEDVIEPVLRARRVILVEEGVRSWGWGSEVAAALYERAGERLPGGAIRRIGARSTTIPVSRPLEEYVLPQVEDILEAARALMS